VAGIICQALPLKHPPGALQGRAQPIDIHGNLQARSLQCRRQCLLLCSTCFLPNLLKLGADVRCSPRHQVYCACLFLVLAGTL
jgi:hypothetical protein